MSLRKKIALVVFMAVASFVGLDNLLQEKNFGQRFERFDLEQAKENHRSVRDRFQEMGAELSNGSSEIGVILQSFGELNETQWGEFAKGRNYDVAIALDPEGWVKHYHLAIPGQPEVNRLREFPNERFSKHNPLWSIWNQKVQYQPGVVPEERDKHLGASPGRLQPGSVDDSIRNGVDQGTLSANTSANQTLIPKENFEDVSSHGLLETSAGALLVGSGNSPDDSIRIIVGRFILPEFLTSLDQSGRSQTRVADAQELMSSVESMDLVDALLTSSEGIVVHSKDKTLESSGLVNDILGSPVFVLQVQTPKQIVSLWAELRRQSILSMFALAIICPLALLFLIQLIVTGPLRTLTAHTVAVGRDKAAGERLNMKRKDEIGMLALEFDSMLDQLDKSREEVVQAARLAGMSDVSSGVLHNVGNKLNSVSVTADLSRDAARTMPLKDLEIISDAINRDPQELVAYLTEDPKGQHLPRYMQALVEDMRIKCSALETEALAVSEGVGEVASLIATLQDSDGHNGVKENFELEDQLESILDLCRMSMSPGENIRFELDSPVTGRVNLDRHKLISVLVPVIRNAMESVIADGCDQPQVTLRVNESPGGSLSFQVEDNGLGLDPTDLTRVFGQGETYKENRQGLGLHLASTAAIELGGQLTASTQGLGIGATFTLELPAGVIRSSQGSKDSIPSK